MSGDLVVFALAVGAFAIIGLAIGMLVAPRLGRLAARGDEDESDRID